MRVPKGACLRWGLSADAEALAWMPAVDTGFVVSTEDGTVTAFDARGGSGGVPRPDHWLGVCALRSNH